MLEIIAEPGTHQIMTTREFNAPAELLLRAWTDPELVQQWLGPRDLQMRIETYEAHDGGRWRYIQSAPDGAEYGFHGVFHGTPSVEHGIVQTFEFEGWPGHVSLDTLTFEPTENGTRVRTNTVFQSVEARDGMLNSDMERGMRQSYERMDELVARLQAGE